MRYSYVVIIILAFFLGSCVTRGAVKADSTDELPAIYEKYDTQFKQTIIGMTFEEFSKVWPRVKLVGKKNDFSAYELNFSQVYYTSHDRDIGVIWTGTIETKEYKQTVWFYFSNNKLLQFGQPNIWPSY
jgi:hypothetical protein